jgi:NADH dehydrogenase (ubiquinone) Fe-S protein 6
MLSPDAEALREMQAPNRKGTWTRSQQAREVAMQGPRFEQMIMAEQVRFGPSSLGYVRWRF